MKKINRSNRAQRLEIAVTVGFIIAVMCAQPLAAQSQLAQKLTRLHVIANSDSSEDQELKLKVRDAVLARVGYSSEFSQNEITDEMLQTLKDTASEEVVRNGYTYDVKVSRQYMYFETRHYDGFSLPAGYYDAVRIVIGTGEGKNWWCVLFPPLCLGAAEADIDTVAENAGLSEDDVALIKQDGTGYILKFKVIELFGELLHKFK